MTQTIAVVILTFNRLNLLQRCITHVRQQTRRVDGIIVVNNGSMDGTKEWLEAQADIIAIHQANVGPSGNGAGMQEGMMRGFDWAWSMDDDAYPTPTALEEIEKAMEARPDARMFNSLGICEEDPQRFAVGAVWVRTTDSFLAGRGVITCAELPPFTDANGLVDNVGGHFYMGACFHRSVLERVGLPSRQYYSRGEEVEYGTRIMYAGYHIYSVVHSLVLHHQIPFVSVRVPGKTKDLRLLNPQARYLTIRNGIWTHRFYRPDSPFAYGMRRLGGVVLADVLLAPSKRPAERWAAATSAVRGVWDGFYLSLPTDAGPSMVHTIQT